MQIESLEHRKLFAATINNGILEIVGTSGNDNIRVTYSPEGGLNDRKLPSGLFFVRMNGTKQSFLANQVKEVRIVAGDGDDIIRTNFTTFGQTVIIENIDGSGDFFNKEFGPPTSIDGGAGNDMIAGGPIPETIRGGSGDDIIFAGNGDDFVRGGGGNDSIAGEAGRDTLRGDNGIDTLHGGGSNDRIEVTDQDRIIRSRGTDRNLTGGIILYDHPVKDGLIIETVMQ